MIADLFIKRPKFAIVIAILMMLAGGICLNQLPIAEYPEIAPTSINVQATYTGASAQVVMETLASPIEEELNGLENLQPRQGIRQCALLRNSGKCLETGI